jgi:hypothetical protein
MSGRKMKTRHGFIAIFLPAIFLLSEICLAKGDRKMNWQENESKEREYPYWSRVYIVVIVYTIILIIGLWAFSRMFQ